MEEDSGAILCQISSYKDMLDQVNEEIEANIQRTRHIESEAVRCSEIEKGYMLRESELMKTVSAGEFELNGLTEVAGFYTGTSDVRLFLRSKREVDLGREEEAPDDAYTSSLLFSFLQPTTGCSLKLMEEELNQVKLNLENTVKGISEKRENFIMECNQFQRDIVTGESKEFRELLYEKKALENEKQNLISKIDALKNSTKEFIQEVLGDLRTSTTALQVEIQSTSLENMNVLRDIDELKTLLLKLV